MKDPIRVTTLTRWARSIRRWFSRDEWFVWWLGLPRSRQAPTSSGIVVIQLQNVGLEELTAALDRGRLPMIDRLLKREDYRLQPLAWGLHADSAGGQTQLFYGFASQAVPPPPWQRLGSRGLEPDDLRTWEQELAQVEPGLLKGGSVYNIYLLGEAAEAHHCATSPGWSDQWAARGPHRILVALLFYAWIFVRLVLGTIVAAIGTSRDQFVGKHPRPRWRDLPRRVLVSILLRELATLGVCADCARGVPIIYANLHGGEQGPRMLSKLDQSIGRIWRAAHRGAGREYDLWILTNRGSLTPAHPVTAETSKVVDAISDWASSRLAAPAEPKKDEASATKQGSWLEIDWLSRLWLRNSHHASHLESSPLRVSADNGVVRIEGATALPEDQQRELRQLVLAAMDAGWLVSSAHDSLRWSVADNSQAALNGLDPDQHWPAWWSNWIQEQARRSLKSKPPADWLVLIGSAPSVGPDDEPATPPCGALLVPTDIAAHRPDQPWTLEELRTSLIRFRRRPLGNGQPVQPRRHGQVRVMTYNIHAAVGMDGELSCDRIARVIAQADADVVCLQEVDVGRARSHHVNQAAEIARQLQMEFCFFPARTQGDEQFGNAILSRFPFQSARLDQLYQEKPTRSGRSAMWLTVELPDERRLQVINTHLSIYPREQALQARELAEHWASQATAQGPTILCGDFNAGPQSATCRTLREVLEDVEDHPGAGASTYFSPFPVARVDHLLVSPGLPVAQAQVVSSRLARSASDHLPLYCDLFLPPN